MVSLLVFISIVTSCGECAKIIYINSHFKFSPNNSSTALRKVSINHCNNTIYCC